MALFGVWLDFGPGQHARCSGRETRRHGAVGVGGAGLALGLERSIRYRRYDFLS